MKLTIPLYVEEHRPKGAAAPTFAVRPLFFEAPVQRGEQLNRVVSKLAGDVRRLLDGLGSEPRHDALAEWTFCPELEDRRFDLKLELRRQTPQVRVTVVSFAALGRRLAFLPALPDVWFEILRGQDLRDRAAEVLTNYLRKQEKDAADAGEGYAPPAALSRQSRGWVTTLDLDVAPRPKLDRPDLSNLLFLGGPEKMSGRAELTKVGRCLDWLYPDDLDRAVLRDAEVAELTKLLEAPDRRPVVLVGRRRVGKTTVVHETVSRRVAKRASPHVLKENVWLLSPQRLISGMIYVGQWENRLLAILDEAKRNEHVLYFDDVLGLYQAGVSRDSDLNVATVMRPYVERRDFRFLAEMTPEALRVLQERDRGFADLLHVVPVNEPPEPQTRRVLVSVARDLEGKHACRYTLDVIPTVLDLTNRYHRESAHPGKSAGMLRDLATRYRLAAVARQSVLEDFHARSGLSVTFLDPTARLERAQVVEELTKHVVGQTAAVDAMADTVCVAKARLNDPGRPLASMLFLGPTGVGKTQSAKALAAYLFGSADRLVRFDMNEYVGPLSPARLVGTFAEPEGLLTSAIRRQPFSVVLLDEIEKAHPAVFDLLLQVLGEGRLTDALGRTADFANAIIVMTSNLGAREAGMSFGLRPGDGRTERAVYVAAAERFFRPEFINRIDRVVPFEPLSREEVGRIARKLMADVFARDGLVQRRCVLQVEPEAMERIVDEGYHPQLGARALKRAIERQLTGPVANRLAAMPAGAPTVVSVYPRGQDIAVHTQELVQVERSNAPRVDLSDPDFLLDRVEDALTRIEHETAGLQHAGPLTQGKLSGEQLRYLAIRELAGRVRGMVERADRTLERRRRPSNWVRTAPRTPRRRKAMKRVEDDSPLWKELLAAQDLGAHLSELLAEPEPSGDLLEDQLAELVETLTLLHTMAAAPADGSADRCAVYARELTGGPTGEAYSLYRNYLTLFRSQHHFAAGYLGRDRQEPGTWLPLPPPFGAGTELVLMEMPGILNLMCGEAGTHLFFPTHRPMAPVQVMVLPVGPDDDPMAVAEAHARRRVRWQTALASGNAEPEGNPFRLGPVVRVYEPEGSTVDLGSGLVVAGVPDAESLRRILLARLSPPPELVG